MSKLNPTTEGEPPPPPPPPAPTINEEITRRAMEAARRKVEDLLAPNN